MSEKDLSRDPILNTIHGGIKKPINVLLANECFPGAVTLIYCAIDAMAFLNLPPERTEVEKADFVQWAERYLKFPCKEQLSGLDLYGARCSVLHTHGVASRLSRRGECRMIGYADNIVPEVLCNRKVRADLVIVSITGLAATVFSGIDKFLIDLFSDRAKAAKAEERLAWMLQTIPRDKINFL